jgi:hypothetical protein
MTRVRRRRSIGCMESDVRTPPTEEEIREHARALMRTRSPRNAAKALGISRESALSLAAGAPVSRGTLALAREHLILLTKP